MQLDFDLQLFGGFGGKDNTSTQTTTYTPTEYELALQGMAKNWAQATQPNALWLNDTARQSLESSLYNLGQLDYGSALGQSIGTIGGAQNGIYSNLENLNYGTLRIDDALADIASRYTPIADQYISQLEGLVNSNNRALNKTNSEYDAYKQEYGDIADLVNRNIGSLIPRINQGMDSTNAKLSAIEEKLGTTFDETNAIRDRLIQGYLPEQYLTNMENAIRSTLNRTMGSNLNSMANRGVINSSVNTRAMNDISRNASDSVAKEYQSNISLIDSLLGTKASNALSLLGQQANLANQEYANLLNAMDRNFNIYNTQGQNSFYALGQKASLAQQQLSNVLNANNYNANYFSQGYNAQTNALNQQANIQNQRYNNLGNTINTSNSGLASIINSAGGGLNVMNTANAGALSRGSNLWSMANALGGNTTSALAAASGKGTQTTSTTQPSGGDFFSNLLAGAQIASTMMGNPTPTTFA